MNDFVQLSRSLLVGRRDTRPDCLSAEDSTTSRTQRVDADDDVIDEVSRLPDSLAVAQPRSDVIERLTEKSRKECQEAVKQLEAHLSHLSQECETEVRTVSQQLLSSLQDADHRLDTLKFRMDQMEHLDCVTVQELSVLWEEVQQEVELKKTSICELNLKLSQCERRRGVQVGAVFRRFCHLLENVVLPPAELLTLIHAKATMLNQSLLANRRSAARLLLLLQEENLQHQSLLRRHWEDLQNRWKRTRVTQLIEQFRWVENQMVDRLCITEDQLTSDQLITQTRSDLPERRLDAIYSICSLVPPTCSTALVSDWFDQLTAINQQIERLHGDLLHQLRCSAERSWRCRLEQVDHCQEALSALQLSEQEVNHIVSSQLLPLIGRRQSQDEERLAALDVCCDSAARHALCLSRCAFAVMRAAALLWETHSRRLARREEELQRHLDELRHSQQQHIQEQKVLVDEMLGCLRQESSEDALKTSLDQTVLHLQVVTDSCRQCVSAQCSVLDSVPSLFMEELFSYSSSLSSLFQLSHAYRPGPEELQNLHLSSFTCVDHLDRLDRLDQLDHLDHLDPGANGRPETVKPEMTAKHPIGCQQDAGSAQDAQDWLAEAESSLAELCDINTYVTFTSSGGVAYTGPAFRCPAPSDSLHTPETTHLDLFPAELLTHTLSRTRTLVLDHLEQCFRGALSSAVAMVTERKEALRSEQEVQLQQLRPEHVLTPFYLLRHAELQLHRRRVDVHCEDVLDTLTSCRTELQQLQASIAAKNQDFTAALSNMEDGIWAADSSRRLDAVSSALQHRLDQHIKATQQRQSSFRQTVQVRLEEARTRTTQLLSSFRRFSEGGDVAPQELRVFQRRLTEETRRIGETEASIFSELEAFESRSLQQTANSNHQQSVIGSRLEDLRKMMEYTQVCPDQLFPVLSSVREELRKRCQYLDLDLASVLQDTLTLPANVRKQVCPAPASGLLQPSRTGVDLLEDPVVGVIRFLNRFSLTEDAAAESNQRGAAVCVSADESPVQRQQSVSTLSVRRSCRSIRMDTRFHRFGLKPEAEPTTCSFSSSLNSVLQKANDDLLLLAEDFYCSRRVTRSQLLPDSVDQWADGMQQRLLGYQEEAQRFLSMSREEVVQQCSVLGRLLRSLPAVLILNHERQQEAGLREEVGGVRQKLEEMQAASKKERVVCVSRLRPSLSQCQLQTLTSREEQRQQQLFSATCSAHLEIQECVRVRGEEFVTSLVSLTEELLHEFDRLLTPAETDAASTHYSTVTMETMETGAETGSRYCLSSTAQQLLHNKSLKAPSQRDNNGPNGHQNHHDQLWTLQEVELRTLMSCIQKAPRSPAAEPLS
ncbi:uncharacterized protein ccdc180 [Stegastes partitus]|uniref:Uncharacterized protein ccdc180 n=1 Tax=Stegastes partitus TaxID=144197 RepID=A0A9Y4NQL6_9TELE|nr:PREDICTED: coiled-coil domain-containing protein 180 [Stegastes partitus]